MGLEPIRTNVHWILSPTCLPIPPLEQTFLPAVERGLKFGRKTAPTFQGNPRPNQNLILGSIFRSLSEKRDSNPRPPPWQGGALPAELFSHYKRTCYLIAIADANLIQFSKKQRNFVRKVTTCKIFPFWSI